MTTDKKIIEFINQSEAELTIKFVIVNYKNKLKPKISFNLNNPFQLQNSFENDIGAINSAARRISICSEYFHVQPSCTAPQSTFASSRHTSYYYRAQFAAAQANRLATPIRIANPLCFNLSAIYHKRGYPMIYLIVEK